MTSIGSAPAPTGATFDLKGAAAAQRPVARAGVPVGAPAVDPGFRPPPATVARRPERQDLRQFIDDRARRSRASGEDEGGGGLFAAPAPVVPRAVGVRGDDAGGREPSRGPDAPRQPPEGVAAGLRDLGAACAMPGGAQAVALAVRVLRDALDAVAVGELRRSELKRVTHEVRGLLDAAGLRLSGDPGVLRNLLAAARPAAGLPAATWHDAGLLCLPLLLQVGRGQGEHWIAPRADRSPGVGRPAFGAHFAAVGNGR